LTILSRLRDDALEHAVCPREALDLLLDRRDILALDRGARLLDDGLRLVDRVTAEVAGGDDLLDLREEALDLDDELLGLLLCGLELVGAPPLEEVVLGVVDHRLDLVAREA